MLTSSQLGPTVCGGIGASQLLAGAGVGVHGTIHGTSHGIALGTMGGMVVGTALGTQAGMVAGMQVGTAHITIIMAGEATTIVLTTILSVDSLVHVVAIPA